MDIEFLTNNKPADGFPVQTTPTFADDNVRFLTGLGENLAQQKQALPEVAALAFWLRPGNLKKLKADYEQQTQQRQAAGLVLHIAPANVDTLFIYSWTLSLLCGNTNILRLSQKHGESARLICQQINLLFNNPLHTGIKNSNWIVSWPHDDKITQAMSAISDRRIIWGGDHTVEHITRIKAKPCTQDITFPDRLSAMLIDAESILNGEQLFKQLTERFIRDAFAFQQMACTSPKIIFWQGEKTTCEQAQQKFWPAIHKHLAKYEKAIPTPSELYQRRTQLQYLAMNINCKIDEAFAPYFVVVNLEKRPVNLEDFNINLGTFLQLNIKDYQQGLRQLSNKYQSCGYWGMEKSTLDDWRLQQDEHFFHRLVPVGQMHEFSWNWDGINLFQALTNKE